jgi:hypothetical protein
MKILKLLGKFILCISISMYGLPVYASTSATASKVELSDSAMSAAIGGSMHAEILSAPATGTSGTVKALVAVGNSGCCTLVYALEAVDINGNVQRTLTSGTISGNKALVISGQGLGSDTIYRARVDFSNANIAGLEAVDTVWTQFQ